MSEEEVIKRLKQTIQLDKEVFGQNSKNFEIEEILLKYIEKLQKENEELEAENFSLNEMKRYNRKHYISKDIIRNKIKELTGEIHRTKKGRIILKDIKRLAKIEVLKELLGE